MMDNSYNAKVLLKYNLQFFAEEGQGGEKTEQPTTKKKEKAREEGQVAKSTEVTTALLLVTIFSALKLFGPSIVDRLVELIKNICGLFTVEEFSITYVSGLFEYVIYEMFGMLWPILLTAFAVGFISNYIQVGWHPTTKPLTPKLSNINPANGFKRLFSLKAVIELVKSLLKISIILAIVYSELKDYEKLILTLYSIDTIEAYAMILNICLGIGIKVGAFFLIVAAIDYAYQRYDLNKKLKMTKQEIKDEYKQSEGNPQIKSKIRQIMRQASMRRMMQDLPKADVIITNPTHFAVAIYYNDKGKSAPVVIAKGADLVAARIKEKGKELEIEIVENKPLARSLFYTVEIGDEIPQELYQAVAEVLAFVYNLKKNS
jgi:flagellar biosynthetic protein FlhB